MVRSWAHTHFSYAGKLTLFNNALLSYPNYLLSSRGIPDAIVDNLAKIAREFF